MPAADLLPRLHLTASPLGLHQSAGPHCLIPASGSTSTPSGCGRGAQPHPALLLVPSLNSCSPCPNPLPSLTSKPPQAHAHASCKAEHCLVHTDLPPLSHCHVSCGSSKLGSTSLTTSNPPTPLLPQHTHSSQTFPALPSSK